MGTEQPTPKRRWRPRFSLLTLVLGVLFVGACGGLWWRWEPWVLVQTIRNENRASKVGFSPDGRSLHVICSKDEKRFDYVVHVYDFPEIRRRFSIDITDGGCFWPNNQWLVVDDMSDSTPRREPR